MGIPRRTGIYYSVLKGANMYIIVDSLPKEKSECLFSYHSCEYGWLCKLYRSKETDRRKRMMCPEVPKCEIEDCPYLREESLI